jgi:DNA primase large subunit
MGPVVRISADTSCSKHLPLSEHRESSDVNQLYHERRKDHISHFVLRLAFCRTEDQRKWLLQQETELFRCVKLE